MLKYIFLRFLAMVPTLAIASLLIFAIIELPPGDYFESYVAELEASGEAVDPKKIEYLRNEHGFDKPMWQRYITCVWGMLHGDFGYSFEYERPVSELIGRRLFLTMLLSFVTIIFTWLIAFLIGIYSATHKYSMGDYGFTLFGLLGLATANFLLALIMLYFAKA